VKASYPQAKTGYPQGVHSIVHRLVA
jgi:hypothetical protein